MVCGFVENHGNPNGRFLPRFSTKTMAKTNASFFTDHCNAY